MVGVVTQVRVEKKVSGYAPSDGRLCVPYMEGCQLGCLSLRGKPVLSLVREEEIVCEMKRAKRVLYRESQRAHLIKSGLRVRKG